MAQPYKRLLQVLVVVAVPVGVFYWAWRSAYTPATPPTKEPVVELALDKQKLIWNNEHITFELEKRFGKAFLMAMLKYDATRVQGFARDSFRGHVLGENGTTTRRKEFLSEERRDKSTSPVNDVTKTEWAARLLKPLHRFERIKRQRLRVLQIEQISDKRWKAKLLMDFVGVDKNKQPLMYHADHRIECTISDELKIDKTPILERWYVDAEVWRHSSQTLLEEITYAAGLRDLPIPDNWKLPPKQTHQYSFQVAVADYNKDGYPDIAVSVMKAAPLLLKSIEGKHFENVTASFELLPPRNPFCFVATWFDYDNDGWPDLLLGDRLYHNQEGKGFRDVTGQSGLRFYTECMGAVTADYDGDGRLDLYVLYQKDHEEMRHGSAPKKLKWVDEADTGKANQLWRNEGNGRFRDVTEQARAGGGKRHTFAASWFFYDDDHRPDLYIANDFGKNVVLRNKGDGTFEDVSAQSGAEDFATSMGVATGDIDNDGHTDIYVANMFSKMGRRIIGQVCEQDYPAGIYDQIKGSCAGNRLYVKNNKRYHDVSEPMGVNGVGWAFAPALFDLDGDGWLDIYACTGFMSFTHDEPDG